VLARLYAGWLLAISLVKTLFLMVFAPGKRGLRRFVQNYRQDRLLPLSTHEQRSLPSISGCIACGRCADSYAACGGAGEPVFGGLMGFMLSSTRSMPDFEAAAQSVERFDDAWLQRLEQRCPAAIPFREVAAFVRSYQGRLDGR
jgi:hypothetical protein